MAAAYNLQQSLEGAGLASSNFIVKDAAGSIQSYWSPAEAMLVPFALLLIYCAALIPAYCIAWFAIKGKRGIAIALASLCLPGLISLIGFWPAINLVPAAYDIKSAGSLGSPYGMSAIAILALLSGWTGVVIATDAFCLQDRFRHTYDHIWYSAAIIGGVFFVADTGTTRETRQLQDTTKHVQQASSYLLKQVKDYKKYCRDHALEQTASCRWASDVQQSLADYSYYDDRLYWQVGSNAAADLYSILGDESKGIHESEIRLELESYNQIICPSTKNRFALSSDSCQRPFAEFCTGVTDGIYMVRPVAIANECIVPTLVRLRSMMEKQVATIESAAIAKHERWFFYIIFALFAGGKVANATAKLTKSSPGKPGLGDQSNVFSILAGLWNFAFLIVKFLNSFIRAFFNLARRVVAVSFKHIFEALKKAWVGMKKKAPHKKVG